MRAKITAKSVPSSALVLRQQVQRVQDADDRAAVVEQDLPRQRAHQVGHEERQHDQRQQEVLEPPALAWR